MEFSPPMRNRIEYETFKNSARAKEKIEDLKKVIDDFYKEKNPVTRFLYNIGWLPLPARIVAYQDELEERAELQQKTSETLEESLTLPWIF